MKLYLMSTALLNSLIITTIVLFFGGCSQKETLLMQCKTPIVEKAKAGKDELEFINNVFVELEQLRAANEVCK